MNDTEAVRLASVVIPCRNGARHLAAQLDALAAQSCPFPFEILVADNGSVDASAAVARSFMERLPNLRVVDASARPGSAAARNIAVAAAKGDVVCFCDADDVVSERWLATLVPAAARHGVATGLIVRVPHEWRPGDPPRERQVPRLSRFLGLLQIHAGSCAVRRSIYEAVGGMNEQFRCRVDTELTLRLSAAGYRVHAVVAAHVYYRERATLRERLRQRFDWERAAARLYRDYRTRVPLRYSLRDSLATWRGLLCRLPALPFRPASVRRREVLEWANRVGRVVGSLQSRVLFL